MNKADFGCLKGIPAVNVASGCLFRCAYCYARGYSQAPPDGGVRFYANLPELLERELPRKREIPSWAAINTASDCFQPHPEILDVTYRTMEILLGWGIGVSFLTKGEVPKRFIDLFRMHPGKVLANIGLISASPLYCREYERYAAPPETRLRSIAALAHAGIVPEVRMDPMIPFLTDRDSELAHTFGAVRGAGVERATLSYIHLRPPIAEQLKREISPVQWKLVESCFHSRDWDTLGFSSWTKILPRALREKGYARARKVAADFGVSAAVCQCKNPDMVADLCGSGRVRPAESSKGRDQLSLFRC
ncbi:MAG TPA: radical SAM protein [Thermodesulfobacteriota bacterium]|nr:radical SAM protein [Thermodesulfobacteriota bacterium]